MSRRDKMRCVRDGIAGVSVRDDICVTIRQETRRRGGDKQ